MKAVVDALQRRADALPEGAPLRALLLQRLAAHAAAAPAPGVVRKARPRPLAALLAWLPPAEPTPRLAESARRDWAQLRLAQRLAQPLAEPTSPRGPLHAEVLVPRALTLLQQLSPGYLQHLMEQVDALNALLPLAPAEVAPPKATKAAKAPKAPKADEARKRSKPARG